LLLGVPVVQAPGAIATAGPAELGVTTCDPTLRDRTRGLVISGREFTSGTPIASTVGEGPPVSDTAIADESCDGTIPTGAEPAVEIASEPALSRWRGSIDLYRRGVYSMQRTWHWCTAAGAQIMRNIVHGKSNPRYAQQRRMFRYMRAHDRYRIPLRHGVDPAGWAAGLRRFVDPRYQLVTSRSFKAALRSAVRNLRRTNLPVGITVAHGNHAWVLTGFSATADPAKTDDFKVTGVRVTGPLWGRQNRSYGYDMRPNTRLTRKQLKSFFTRWHYAPVRMAWEGRFVSVQPIP